MRGANRYTQIIEKIFSNHYKSGDKKVDFSREEIGKVARDLKIALPKNLGDLIYSFRYRNNLPESIRRLAPKGKEWIIRPAGRSMYQFVVAPSARIEPNSMMTAVKIPDSTPGLIAKYALNDEQALLAKLRYNRLIDIFTGVACYSLQNHLRTTVPGMGQVETDEIYIGVDRRGVHFVFTVQAKGGNDKINVVQIEQDFAVCAAKFPALVGRPIAAQFMENDLIAVFEFEMTDEGVRQTAEKHYKLDPEKMLTREDLELYQRLPDGD